MPDGLTYHAGIRFQIGDLVEIFNKPYFYLGEDHAGYSIFYYIGEPQNNIQRLNVEWHSPTIFGLRLPLLSSVRSSKG